MGLMMVGNESNFPRRKDFVACCSYRTELSCVVRLNVIARVAHVCFQKVEKCYGKDSPLFERRSEPATKKAFKNWQLSPCKKFHVPMSNRNAVLDAKALEPNDLSLTCAGMGYVNWDWSDSFVEFVFDNKACRVSSVLAEFLSPKVARLRRCDISFDVYRFKESEMFNVFESLVSSLHSGDALRVEKSNFPVLVRLSQEFENAELLSSLLGMIETETLSLEEEIPFLRFGIELGTAFSDRFRNVRDFVASHFYKLKKQLLDNIDLETAKLLLSSPSLQIEDEDSLYNFVRSRAEVDLRFASLFEFVCFDYLSVDCIENFSSFANDYLLENINSSIWSGICRRLVLKAEPKQKKNLRQQARNVDCKFNSSKKLDGIIAYLTRECGGNVHSKGIVYVMGSGWDQPRAVELEEPEPCYHASGKNAWICYDFGGMHVLPERYVLRSSSKDNELCPESWVIEVSNDGYSWLEIDRREQEPFLRYGEVKDWICTSPNESFRFFRLRVPENNAFEISAMEIFGTLFMTTKTKPPRPLKQDFVYQEDSVSEIPGLFPQKLDGIIAYLTRECGGNVHDKGIVDVTASSFKKTDTEPKNAAGLALWKDAVYCSREEPNSWICYDFKGRRVIPTSYSVMTNASNRGYIHLKSWVVEVSNDRELWIEIDRRTNNKDLNNECVTHNFKISKVPSESFRFFRLRQTGPNHSGQHMLCIYAMEVFGTLFEE